MTLAAGAREGFVLGILILALSIYLAIRQRVERRNRSEAASLNDRKYFDRKDFRRFTNAAVMALIALGIMVLGFTDPRAAKGARLAFVGILVAVGLLLVLLIVLAVIDWFATAEYARRHRKALAEERLAIIEKEARRLAYRRGQSNGHGNEKDLGV